MKFVAYDVCRSVHGTATSSLSDTLKNVIIDKHHKVNEFRNFSTCRLCSLALPAILKGIAGYLGAIVMAIVTAVLFYDSGGAEAGRCNSVLGVDELYIVRSISKNKSGIQYDLTSLTPRC